MAEYIEREALLKNAQTYSMEFGEYIGDDVRDVDAILADRVKDAPAADVEPVRHGRWLINSDGYYPYCSECKEEPKSGIMTHYCPNCGAKMDKEDET